MDVVLLVQPMLQTTCLPTSAVESIPDGLIFSLMCYLKVPVLTCWASQNGDVARCCSFPALCPEQLYVAQLLNWL